MTNKPPDVIWLQWFDAEGHPYEYGSDVTWCEDKQDDEDPKYLLATPEREAAGELQIWLTQLHSTWHICTGPATCPVARLIAKATGEKGEEEKR